MNILIFGSNGMLGRYLSSYLSTIYSITQVNRKELDIYKSFNEKQLLTDIQTLLKKHKPVYIINCAGVINKRPDLSVSEMYIVNSYFPNILSKICIEMDIKLIHPSTDCVFSGKNGPYKENAIPDAYDDYGVSKAIAENITAFVIRVSIIGEEINNRSLVEWAKSNKNNTIDGYTNHYWNGITCLEYAKIIEEIINKKSYYVGVKNFSSTYKNENYISKYDLVKEISDVYNLNITVKSYATDNKCDRRLVSDYTRKDIKEQIAEMKVHNFGQ